MKGDQTSLRYLNRKIAVPCLVIPASVVGTNTYFAVEGKDILIRVSVTRCFSVLPTVR